MLGRHAVTMLPAAFESKEVHCCQNSIIGKAPDAEVEWEHHRDPNQCGRRPR